MVPEEIQVPHIIDIEDLQPDTIPAIT